MKQRDPLSAAAAEVNAVAGELREVKKRAEQYGQAATRLGEVSAALETMVKSITGIQSQFQALLNGAQDVMAKVEQAGGIAQQAANSVPDIIARIESTDVAIRVNDLAGVLASVNERINEQLNSVVNVVTALGKEQAALRQAFDGLAPTTQKIAEAVSETASRMESLQDAAIANTKNVEQLGSGIADVHAITVSSKETLDDTLKASSLAASAIKVFGDKSSRNDAEVNKKLELILQMLERQSLRMDDIGKKRGVFF